MFMLKAVCKNTILHGQSTLILALKVRTRAQAASLGEDTIWMHMTQTGAIPISIHYLRTQIKLSLPLKGQDSAIIKLHVTEIQMDSLKLPMRLEAQGASWTLPMNGDIHLMI